MSEPKELPGQHFNLPYFFQEVCRLRQMMGDKSFWSKSRDVREQALFGVGFVYLNLLTDDGKPLSPEDNERATLVYDSTMKEYSQRETYCLLSGKTT